jgi:replication factor A2
MESAYAQLPPLQRSIMELVSANDDDDGMHVSAVSKSVGGMSNGEAVM